MEKFVIRGGKSLKGEIEVGGAKNSALKILPAAVLFSEPIIVKNVPQLEDVKRMVELLKELGAGIKSEGKKTLKVDASRLKKFAIQENVAKNFRASIMLAGPILARYGEVALPHPGGCVIGKRPIDLFLEGFKAFGAKINSNPSAKTPVYKIKAQTLKPADYTFRIVSVTGTECLMLTATLIKGKTILRNAACEPEILALAEFLNQCGAKIKGAGSHTIEIEGVSRLRGGVFKIIPDRIEAGCFAILAAATNSRIRIKNVIPEHLSSLILTLKLSGVNIKSGKNYLEIVPRKILKAIDVKTREYPGFPTDLQAPYSVFATQASGKSLIHETVYDGRLFYIEDLNKMGASITMCDPHRIIVNGPTQLYGRDMESPDLRAGLAFVIAALAAKGRSVIDNVYQIDRGHERLEERLQKLGADIKRVKS